MFTIKQKELINNNYKNTMNIYDKYYFSINLLIIISIFICNTELCNLILLLVKDYFKTFRYCWNKTLESLVIMIIKYIDFLNELVVLLTKYPNCIYFCITAIILLWIVYNILSLFIKQNT